MGVRISPPNPSRHFRWHWETNPPIQVMNTDTMIPVHIGDPPVNRLYISVWFKGNGNQSAVA